MGFLSFWGLAAFGLAIGWACVLIGAPASRVRAVAFTVVFITSAVALAYLFSDTVGAVEAGIAAITGLLLHVTARAALRHRAYPKSLAR